MTRLRAVDDKVRAVSVRATGERWAIDRGAPSLLVRVQGVRLAGWLGTSAASAPASCVESTASDRYVIVGLSTARIDHAAAMAKQRWRSSSVAFRYAQHGTAAACARSLGAALIDRRLSGGLEA